MSKAIKEHLKQISAQELKKFRSETYTVYASSSRLVTKMGVVKLGVNGEGKYVVIQRAGDTDMVHDFKNPLYAIKFYQKLVSS